MVFDVLSVLLLAAGCWHVYCQPTASAAAPDLPPDDLPPPAAGTAVPEGRRRLHHYVEAGLDELDAFLRREERA